MEELVNKVAQVRKTLDSLFYKFTDEITASLTAVLTRENFILIGPPGTAKTMLVASTSKLLKARWFYRLLTKFTEVEEVIGPIDVVELLKGNVKRIYTNSIVEADFALLDEIFNASSAILNTMLTILNERVIYDGGSIIPVKTWTVFGATNRIPDEEELQALYDRFPLRVFTKYAEPDETENLIKAGLRLRRDLERLTPLMTMEEVKKLNEYVQSYVYENMDAIVRHISPIVASYLDHVVISNRTRVKVPLYVVSYLSVLGISPSDIDSATLRAATLKVLKYLVKDREDLSEYETFLTTHMPGNLSALYDMVNEIKALVANNALSIAREKIKEAYEILDKSIADPVVYRFFQVEIEEIKSTLDMLRSQL
ncbi:AAA family ATPase [Pyrobaculum neutrophilum]|uniref:ATPase associated with various cellular activities AAA_5 n=1 Tax=Pyrobaculum neutrophilum (strain DSM 2338 / JCM 9278 / NBRC 100436 / V24Sta) TaxID=444157 RepID=B1YB40_PYRNV|nr:AAA family ATPase [Pyrobaculum neutrophilum]ACB40740.1 ATPase associated with various cellular activities AAA_5 [Pyrobaculum neutrophilum V24Sta]